MVRKALFGMVSILLGGPSDEAPFAIGEHFVVSFRVRTCAFVGERFVGQSTTRYRHVYGELFVGAAAAVHFMHAFDPTKVSPVWP